MARSATLSRGEQAALYYARKKSRNRREAGRPAPDRNNVVTIDGVAQVGVELTAVPGTWDGDPALSYTWRSGTNIVGTGETYTPVEDDEGNVITVTENGQNRWGSDGATSAPTDPVAAA